MTLEQILDCSAEQLEAMSDTELLEHFKQYLCVTRPELAPKRQASGTRSTGIQGTLLPINTKTIEAAEQLKKLGVDVSHMFTTKSKR